MFNSPVGQIYLHFANSQVSFHRNVLNFDVSVYVRVAQCCKKILTLQYFVFLQYEKVIINRCIKKLCLEIMNNSRMSRVYA